VFFPLLPEGVANRPINYRPEQLWEERCVVSGGGTLCSAKDEKGFILPASLDSRMP